MGVSRSPTGGKRSTPDHFEPIIFAGPLEAFVCIYRLGTFAR